MKKEKRMIAKTIHSTVAAFRIKERYGYTWTLDEGQLGVHQILRSTELPDRVKLWLVIVEGLVPDIILRALGSLVRTVVTTAKKRARVIAGWTADMTDGTWAPADKALQLCEKALNELEIWKLSTSPAHLTYAMDDALNALAATYPAYAEYARQCACRLILMDMVQLLYTARVIQDNVLEGSDVHPA